MVWISDKLIKIVKNDIVSDKDLDKFRDKLQTVHRKIEIARYHKSIAIKQLEEAINQKQEVDNISNAFEILLGKTQEYIVMLG